MKRSRFLLGWLISADIFLEWEESHPFFHLWLEKEPIIQGEVRLLLFRHLKICVLIPSFVIYSDKSVLENEKDFFFLSLSNWQLYLINEKEELKDSEPQVKGINEAPSETELLVLPLLQPARWAAQTHQLVPLVSLCVKRHSEKIILLYINFEMSKGKVLLVKLSASEILLTVEL